MTARICAQGHPPRNLVFPLLHGIGNHAVDAEQRQQRRKEREPGEKRSQEAWPRELLVDEILERPRRVQGDFGVDFFEGQAQRRKPGGRRTFGARIEHGKAFRRLEQRHVEVGEILIGVGLADVSHHPDHGSPSGQPAGDENPLPDGAAFRP